MKDLVLKVENKEYKNEETGKTINYLNFYVTVEFMGEPLDISLKPKDALSKKVLNKYLTGE